MLNIWYGDLVKDTTTDTGTGNLTLSGTAPTGYLTFESEFGHAGKYFYYKIKDATGANWEIGIGHLSAATTFVRDVIIKSTNSNAAVSFAAGTKTITSPLTADSLVGNAMRLKVPGTDGYAVGPQTDSFNCGYTSSAIGDLVYLDSSGTWQKTDANTTVQFNGLLGIALEVKASGAALLVALPGSIVYAAAAFPTFTVGGPIYMSETAGAVTQTQPTTADAAIRLIGWALHADKLYFFPSPDYITHV